MVKEPDQVGTEGALLVAPAAGRVNQSFYHSNAGNMIQIDHGGGWFTTYIHLQSRAVGVGANVAQGATIGRVGKTGPTSNGHPHLHMEQAIDADNNGSATWGAEGTERVAAVFNGVNYGTTDGMTWRNVTSNNGCAPPPPADDGSVQFADVDGDGLAELVQVRSNGDVVAYRNLGWDAARVYDSGQNKLVATGFTRALEVKFEDLDGDGLAELVQVRSNGDVVAYRNLGWNAARVYDSGQNKLVATGFSDPVSTKFADVDGDGLGELVQVRSNGDVVAYRNLGWNAARVYDSGQNKLVATGFTDPVSTKFADVDNDGRVELVQVRSNDDVVAYRNLGWNAARVYDSGQNKLVATGFTDPVRTKFGDLNGDPAGAEIISIRPNGDVVAYRNLGWNAPKVYDGAESKLVATGFTI
ncbi:VCBS repeat domain-containing M23 family metallopeptidase [Actinomadura alba]|uniref:VCBS repeat domain-containing M23 family metallopeptidase n=2 Tax=Actinomadura alba TaxID=406431 RepID=UPI0031D0F76B